MMLGLDIQYVNREEKITLDNYYLDYYALQTWYRTKYDLFRTKMLLSQVKKYLQDMCNTLNGIM